VASELRHRSSTVRHKALLALARIGDPSSALDLALSMGWCENARTREAVMDSLSRMGEPALESLLVALKDSKACDPAAAVLGRIGDPRAAVPLARAYRETFAGRKILEALKALGASGEEALKAAIRGDADAEARRAAIQALLALQAGSRVDVLAGRRRILTRRSGRRPWRASRG
jgi:HEAT repeat protein